MRRIGSTAALLVLLLLGTGQAAFSQEAGSVRGRVTAAGTARPLASAQVVVVGTGRGAITNGAGEFVVTGVPAGSHAVRVQLLGYAAQERTVSVTGATRVDFELAAQPIALDEVVVTGQPEATRRRAIGASVAVIDAADAGARGTLTTMAELLQGRRAGVTSFGASGTLGAAGTLVLRGVTSINQSNTPAVYVDGVRIDTSEKPLFLIGLGGQTTSRLNDLSPADIERVEVVKGAAASALYGSQASNGVIQIFTKRGRPGESAMNASVRVGAGRIPDVFPLTHPDPKYPSANELLRTGMSQQYGLALRGGTESVRYYASGNFHDDEGSFPSNAFRRANGHVNLWLMPAPTLTAELTSSVAWSRAQLPFNDNNSLGILLNVLAGDPSRGTEADPYGGLFLPATYVLTIANTDEAYRYTGGLTLHHRPSDALSQKATVGVELVAGEGVTQWPYAPNPLRPHGARLVADRMNVSANVDYTATWTQRLGARLESALSAGGQFHTLRDHRRYASGSAFPSPFLTLLGATTTAREIDEETLEYATGGLFAQEQLSLAGRLFLTGGVRVDGSTAFGENFGTQAYPKLSASWVVSEEPWFALPALSTLRLRAGWGKAGTQPGAFDAQRTYLPFTAAGGQPALHLGEVGNPELAPEISTEWEAGFDASLFGERLALDATLYRQTTRDALLRRPIAPSHGRAATQLDNIGTVRNAGVELSAEALLVQTRRVTWRAAAGFAQNDNEVVSMGGVAPIPIDRFGGRVTEGYPLGGKWQMVSTGMDANGYPVGSAAPVYVGTGVPPRTGSLGSRLGLGGLELVANAQWAAGHVVTNNTRAFMLQRRTGEEYHALVAANGDNLANPQTDAVKRELARANLLGEYTERGDWLKLRELGATYTLPGSLSRRFGAERALLHLSARNLLTLTGYSGADPEVSATAGYWNTAVTVVGQELFTQPSVGNDFFTVPQSRQLVIGVDVQF